MCMTAVVMPLFQRLLRHDDWGWTGAYSGSAERIYLGLKVQSSAIGHRRVGGKAICGEDLAHGGKPDVKVVLQVAEVQVLSDG